MSNATLMQENTLLQDAVSSAYAVLFAIEAGDLFRSLPANKDDASFHNHGCYLLDMLAQHLHRVQAEVDKLAADRTQSAGEN